MKRRITAVVALLIVVAVGNPVFARDWFVAMNGNDGNAGTIEQPLATIQTAMGRTQAGDVVQVRGGTYASGVWMDHKAGAPGAPITVRAYDGDWTAHINGGFGLPACSYLRFEGLDVAHNDGQCFNVSGAMKEPSGYDKSHHIDIMRCRLRSVDTNNKRETGTETLKSSQTEYLLVEDCDLGVAGGEDFSSSVCVDWVWVNYSTMRRCYAHDYDWAGVYWKGGSQYDVLEDSVIAQGKSKRFTNGMQTADGTGVQYANPATTNETEYLVARNNIITGVTNTGISIRNTSWFWIYNNLLVNIGDARAIPNANAYRPYISVLAYDGKAPSEHIRVYNNIFLDTAGDMHAPYQHDIGPITDWAGGNNLYWNNGNPVPVGNLVVDGKPVDPATEPGAVFANPMLANPTETATSRKGWVALYRPTAKSTALIDRGNKNAGDTPRPAVLTDMEGKKRPLGRGWDIGPFESKMVQ